MYMPYFFIFFYPVFFKLTLELRKGFLLNADRVLECLMMLEQVGKYNDKIYIEPNL